MRHVEGLLKRIFSPNLAQNDFGGQNYGFSQHDQVCECCFESDPGGEQTLEKAPNCANFWQKQKQGSLIYPSLMFV